MDISLQDLTDREELRSLVSRYAQCVDSRDVAGIADCFSSDAHLEFNSGEVVLDGQHAIRQFFENAFNGPPMGPVGASTHVMSNVFATLDGNTAHVETQAVAYLARTDRPVVVVRGLLYRDDCARLADGWRIRRRIHTALWQAEMPEQGLEGLNPDSDAATSIRRA